MRKNIITLTILFMLLLVNGCMKAPHKEIADDRVGTKPIDTDVPANFDWKTTNDITVNVKINDQYNGQYKYSVQLYLENPLTGEAAAVKGIVTNKSSVTTSITIPAGITILYACQTDPLSRRIVQPVAVTGNVLNVDFTAPIKSNLTKAAGVTFFRGETKASTIPTTPNDAIKVGDNTSSLESGKSYVIAKGSSFMKNISFPWGNSECVLYVEGSWEINDNWMTLPPKVKIIVQNGGRVTGKNNATISLNGDASIQIAMEGEFETGTISIAEDAGTIINNGKLTLSNLKINTNGTVTNNGTLTVDDFTATTNGTFTNNGTANIDDLSFTGGRIVNNKGGILLIEDLETKKSGSSNMTIDNYAKIGITESADIQHTNFNNYCMTNAEDNTKITLMESVINNGNATNSALFTCSMMDIKSGSSTINVGSKSIFEARKQMNYVSGQNRVIGQGKDVSLVRIKKVMLGSNDLHVTYKDLQLECSGHDKANKGNWELENSQMVPDGESTISIPAGECSGTGNTPEEGEGEDQDDDLNNNAVFTYVFEDNWPQMGDYDMNDAVIELNGYTSSVKEKTITLNFKLMAIGATRKIGAAIQLDGVSANDISGLQLNGANSSLESGQKYAVIELFDDAHKFLGNGVRKPINTMKVEYPTKDMIVKIKFASEERVNSFKVSDLNVFIIVDELDENGKRREVHMRGYAPTDKIQKNLLGTGEDDSNNRPQYKSVTNFVWGIMISDKFSYPTEGCKIEKAYSGFITWLGGTNPDWYKTPTGGNVIEIK